MSNMTVPSPVSALAPASACTPAKTTGQASSKPAPKTDVIDMRCPPTPEQAERMRSAGILGYGSVSTSKTVTTETREDGSTVTTCTMDYQHEFFDMVNETTYRHASSSTGALASDGSTAAGVTAQVSFTSLESWPEQLEQTADTLAAAHQAKASYLKLHCVGEDAEQREAELEASYQSVKDMAADSIADVMSYYLENKDKLAFQSDIRASVQATFSRYEAKYSAAADQQPDDGWLGATLYESTARLSIMGSYCIPPSQNGDGSWNLAQYGHVSLGLSAYQSILTAANPDNGAQMLAKFSEVSMRMESEIHGGSIAGKATDLFRLSSKHVYQQLLERIGKTPAPQAENTFSTKV